MKQKRSKHAQNRIAYIVYSNPKATRALIDQHGYQPPKQIHDLVGATKQLIRKKGHTVIKELLEAHPDRKALLSLEKTKEDRFCGACNSHAYAPETQRCKGCGFSSYTGEEKFIDQLIDMSILEIERLYQNTVTKSNKDPQNTNLSEEVRLLWNELRKRKKDEEDNPKNDQLFHHLSDGITVKPKEAMIILGLTLVAGGLIGSAFNYQRSVA